MLAARLAAGATVVGRKIGLTSEAVQRQVGVDPPDFGFLLDDMRFEDGEPIPSAGCCSRGPRSRSPSCSAPRSPTPTTASSVRAAVDYASPAIEVVDSRVRDWDIAITDTVADNASSRRVRARRRACPARRLRAERGDDDACDRGGEEVSSGTGAACLGDPLNALAWLARAAAHYGSPLRPGDVVLSGAFGPLVPVAAGDVLTATISSLGRSSPGSTKENPK